VSAATTHSKTPTAASRKPSGFPMGFYRYRNYTLFAFTSVPIMLCATALIEGANALSHGKEAWEAWLANMAKPHWLALSWVCLGFVLYFAIRFGWVGRKIAAGRIGPVPRPPLPLFLLGVAPLGGFVTVWLILLAILGGAL